MKLHYKIISVDEAEDCIVVRFYSDMMSEEELCVERDREGKITRCRTDYNINLPIPAPQEERLHKFILTKAPDWWLWMKDQYKKGKIDLSHVKELIGKEYTQEYNTPTGHI
jgi:hypothetical protein